MGCTPSLRECALPCRWEQTASGGPFTTGQTILVESLQEPDRIGSVGLGWCEASATRSGRRQLLVLTGHAGQTWR